ncbi:hypothetical protein KI387_040519, partial [Taxus chinensis]
SADEETTDIWRRGWKSDQTLDLGGDCVHSWNDYLAKLRRGHIRLQEEPDCIVWTQNKTVGIYTARLGYKVLMAIENQAACWWWSKIWKVKVPMKNKVFMWLSLNTK